MQYSGKLSKTKQFLSHHVGLIYNRFFNSKVRAQLKNPKSIPIIVINFNQLFYLQKLIIGLQKRGYNNLVIIDNNSTYKPLLDYYANTNSEIKIHKLEINDGHLSFWKQKDLVKKYTKGYYVITDPDIVPINDCPDDFLSTMLILLDKAYNRTKVGFSLKLDDIPKHNPQAPKIKDWEAQFWTSKIHSKAYKAEVDTTFAIYRPGYIYKKKNFTKAWRTDFPLQALHGGWYINPNNLTEEQSYYQKTANQSASWLLEKDGELKNKLHHKVYTNAKK